MGTQVTHGADTDRIRQLAEQLAVLACQVGQVEQEGTAQLGTLEAAWAGDDTDVFTGDWQAASPQLLAVSDRLSAFAKMLVEQAQQQDNASGASGSSMTPVGPRGRAQPTLGGVPRGLPTLGWPDLRVGLKAPNVDWPGAGASVSPINSPFVQWPLQYYRDIYEDWQDSGLTWFEAMFVPWPLPDKYRNRYLDMMDDGTDWANDFYKEHVRDLPGIRETRWAAHKANDAVEFADFFIAPLDRAFGPTAPGLAWNMLKGTVNETTEMLDDPKGWWDGASGLDQAGFVVSLVPAAGLVGKAAAKTTKEVVDLLSGTGKHVPSTKRIWDDDLVDLDDATKLKNSDDPYERGYALNAERAQQRLTKYDIQTPDDVWKAGNEPRGLIIEALNGGNLPPGFKTVDRLENVNGVDRVVSTKTLDPSATTYDGKPKAIEHKLNGYLDELHKFDEGSHSSKKSGISVRITEDDYEAKVFEVFVRPGSMSDADWAAVDRVRSRADEMDITMEVKEYP